MVEVGNVRMKVNTEKKELVLKIDYGKYKLVNRKRKVLFQTNSDMLGYVPLKFKDLKDYAILVRIVSKESLRRKLNQKKNYGRKVEKIPLQNIRSQNDFENNHEDILKHFGNYTLNEKRKIIKMLVRLYSDEKQGREKENLNKDKLMQKAIQEYDQFYRHYNPNMDVLTPKNELLAGTGSNISRKSWKTF